MKRNVYQMVVCVEKVGKRVVENINKMGQAKQKRASRRGSPLKMFKASSFKSDSQKVNMRVALRLFAAGCAHPHPSARH